MVRKKGKYSEIAHRAGKLFDSKITKEFWSSFKGEAGKIQAEVLVYLHDHNEGRISEIAEELNVPKQHISKIVIGFIEDGLVQSRASKKDKRSNILSLTSKGKAYMEEHFEQSDQYFNQLLDSMDKNDQEEFIQALKKIDEILSK